MNKQSRLDPATDALPLGLSGNTAGVVTAPAIAAPATLTDGPGESAVPKDETFLSGLIWGGVVVGACFWAMPAPSAAARATHEPSHVSLSRPSVSVAIAGDAR